MNAEPVHEVHGVLGESNRDSHVGDGVFKDEIPADDPRDQLAHGRVGVGVGRTSDGDHGGKLGVAEAGECADDGDENERNCESGSGAGASGERGVMNKIVEQRSIEDRGGVKPFASDGGADDGEDSGADDRSNA